MKYLSLLLLFFIIVCSPCFLYCEETIWYWNGTDSLNDKNHLRLKKIGINKIFLKAGHFWFYKNQFGINSFKYPESTGNLKKFDLHLVYTFTQSGKDNFYKQMIKDPNKAIKYILDTVEWQISIFSYDKHPIKGLQFDLEGHVNLALYTRLLKAVKKKFPTIELSIALQPFWKKKKDFEPLLKAVDFYCLMLYDFFKSKKQYKISKIADLDWIIKEISKFNLLQKPFYAGLPTYSYSLLYNKKGKLIKSWAPFRLEGLSENKFFKYKSTKYSLAGSFDECSESKTLERKTPENYNGEQLTTFEAIENSSYSNLNVRKGYTVTIIRITPASVSLYSEKIKSYKFKYLLGNTYFRLGMDWEQHVLTARQLQKSYFGLETTPLKFKMCRSGKNFFVKLTASKDTESICDRSASGMIIEFQNRFPNKIKKGEFDNLKSNGKKHILYEYHISPGEKIRTGLIPDKFLPAIVSVWIKDADSFKTIWSKKQYFTK